MTAVMVVVMQKYVCVPWLFSVFNRKVKSSQVAAGRLICSKAEIGNPKHRRIATGKFFTSQQNSHVFQHTSLQNWWGGTNTNPTECLNNLQRTKYQEILHDNLSMTAKEDWLGASRSTSGNCNFCCMQICCLFCAVSALFKIKSSSLKWTYIIQQI